ASLSMGVWSGFQIAGKVFFDQLDWFANNVLLPLGGMFTALFVAWIWGVKNALREISNDGTIQFGLGNVWGNVMMKWVSPALVAIIFLAGIGIIKL
ncbi:MAG: sodium-dependent transporter, partial [Firmicutes bacterium]|nr:sodium-dependent transporter [Bacillota bacterium]